MKNKYFEEGFTNTIGFLMVFDFYLVIIAERLMYDIYFDGFTNIIKTQSQTDQH
jgi:hypothetical protein